jgi:predicted  nucleic acid-binding Zn-ribbon protein
LKLKEIDSLAKMRINYLKTKSEQNERLSKLNERQEAALMQTTKLKQETVSTHTQLAEIEQKLKSFTEQRQRLIDLGGDEKKIQNYQLEIAQLEEKGMETLLRLDEIEQELKDNKTFLTGIEKTIQEIQNELAPEFQKIEQELGNVDLRSNLLIEELPGEYKTLLQKTTAKNLAFGPFTRIEQGSCYFCRYKISRMEESEIDMQKNLKTCPQCSRIFLPYGA